MWPPLQCVVDSVNGKSAALPPYPLCALGLETHELKLFYGTDRCADWWDVEFEMGRVPFDSKYCAVWHAPSESFVPIKRGVAGVSLFDSPPRFGSAGRCPA